MARVSTSEGTRDRPGTKGSASTRERILDVALDLFVEKGYDKTSLREIAEIMGFTKAALYYHFASKDDILLALHMRLHELGRVALRRLDQMPAGVGTWSTLLQGLVDDMLAQRKLLLLHERNHAAMETVQEQHKHDEANQDMEAAFRDALSDDSLSHRDRVRIGSSIGALFAGLVLSGDMLADIPVGELATLLRDVIGDLLTPPKPSGRRSSASS